MRQTVTGGPPAAVTPATRAQGAAALRQDIEALDPNAAALGAALAELQTTAAPPPPRGPVPVVTPVEFDIFDQMGGGAEPPPVTPLGAAPTGGPPPAAPPPAPPGIPPVGAGRPPLPPDEDDIFGPPPGASAGAAPRPGANFGPGQTGTPAMDVAGFPSGRPLATRAATIVAGGDTVRVSKVDDRGRVTYIDDWTAQEIGAAGDLTRFLQEFVAPHHGGGVYRAEKHTSKPGVFIALGDIRVAGPVGGAAPVSKMASTMEETLAMVKMMDEQRRQGEEAAKARDEEIRRQQAAAQSAEQSERAILLQTLLKKQEGGGSSGGMAGMMEMAMAMRLMDSMGLGGYGGQPAGGGYDLQMMQQQFQQQIQQLQAQQQQQLAEIMAAQRLPPPLPPEAPPTDWVAVAQGVAAVFGAIVSPIAAAFIQRPDPVERWLPVLAPVLTNVLTPKPDPAVAVLAAKLDMMAQGEPAPDPFDQIDKLARVIKTLSPQADNGSTLKVWERAIDRGPELIGSFGKAVREALQPPVTYAQDPGIPRAMAAPEQAQAVPQAAPAAPMLPAPLIALRDALIAVPPGEDGVDGTDQIVKLLEALQDHLPKVARCGQPWQALCEELFLAAGEANVAGVRTAIVKLAKQAWGEDKRAHRPFARLFQAYAKGAIAPGMPAVAIVVANQIREAQGRPLLGPDGRPIPTAPTAPQPRRAHAIPEEEEEEVPSGDQDDADQDDQQDDDQDDQDDDQGAG